MRNPAFCLCENKDAADQRLCFHYMDSTIPLLSKSEISSLWPFSACLQPGLCRTWSETSKFSHNEAQVLPTRIQYPKMQNDPN